MYTEQHDTSSTIDYEKELEASFMSDLLSKLVGMNLPDAIDIIMLGPSESEAGQPGYGFARYAARLFAEVGASRIRDIAVSHDLEVVRLSGPGTFWVRFSGIDLSEEEREVVLAAEGAMNRLLFVKEAFDVQTAVNSYSEEDCSQADVTLIETVAGIAPALAAGAESNPLFELFGTQGAKGGEWDVRTRFAMAVEALRLPYRLSYEFDCNVSAGVFGIDYLAPLSAWMPQHVFLSEDEGWKDVSDVASHAAMRYTLELGVVLAAIAFGTSVGIRKVRFRAHPGRWESDPNMTLFVDRLAFISDVLPLIKASDREWMRALLEGAATEDDAFDETLAAHRVDPSHDMRPAPEDLKDLLRAQTMADLDVLSPMGEEAWESLNAARADMRDAPLAAIAVLEELVAQADESVRNLPSNTMPLYCETGVARVAVPLASLPADVQFVRYSDVGFYARDSLCDLYRQIGEPDRSFRQALLCIDLAPTSAAGYIDAANALADQEKYAEAIPFLENALRFAPRYHAISFVYYRLAFALWQTGKLNAALACYVMSMFFGNDRAEAIRREMAALLHEMDSVGGQGTPVVPDVEEARAILREEGIVVAPSAELIAAIARALVPLVDAGAFGVSGHLARFIAPLSGHRDELVAVANSLEPSA